MMCAAASNVAGSWVDMPYCASVAARLAFATPSAGGVASFAALGPKVATMVNAATATAAMNFPYFMQSLQIGVRRQGRTGGECAVRMRVTIS